MSTLDEMLNHSLVLEQEVYLIYPLGLQVTKSLSYFQTGYFNDKPSFTL